MKYLKFVQKGYEDYTGSLGVHDFKNGVSVNPIPRGERDRLAAAFQFVEFEEGGEETPAGVAYRLVSESAMRAPDPAPLKRQSDEEKNVEDALIAISQEPERPIYTYDELTKIADKRGINGLREIAQPWDVKHRAIPNLIELILNAQKDWLEKRQAKLKDRLGADAAFELIAKEQAQKEMNLVSATDAEDDAEDAVEGEVIAESEGDEDEDPDLSAAATGDMAAALKE